METTNSFLRMNNAVNRPCSGTRYQLEQKEAF